MVILGAGVLAGLSPRWGLAEEQTAGQFILQVRIFERPTQSCPRTDYRELGGTLYPSYPGHEELNKPVVFQTAGTVDLFPADNIALERVNADDQNGQRALYCSDLELGLLAGWAQQHHARVIPLHIIRTLDGSAPPYAQVEGGPGCDAF
jgi:hypothetical protein